MGSMTGDRRKAQAMGNFVEMQCELAESTPEGRLALLQRDDHAFWETLDSLPLDGIDSVISWHPNEQVRKSKVWQERLEIASKWADRINIYLDGIEQQPVLEPGGSTVLVDDLGRTRALLEVDDGLVYDVYEKKLGVRGLAKYGLRKAYISFAYAMHAEANLRRVGAIDINAESRLEETRSLLPGVYVSMGLGAALISYNPQAPDGERYACIGQTGAEFQQPLKNRLSPAAGAMLGFLGESPDLRDKKTYDLALAGSTELAGLADATRAGLILRHFTEASKEGLSDPQDIGRHLPSTSSLLISELQSAH